MELEKFSYAVEGENADPRQIVIKKGNIEAKFTIADMEGEQVQCEKIIREIEGKLKLEHARATNIETHHPFVKEMSDKDLLTAHLYYEAQTFLKGLPPRLEAMKAQLAESVEEKAHILKTLGITLMAPEEVKEKAIEASMENPKVAPTTDEHKA